MHLQQIVHFSIYCCAFAFLFVFFWGFLGNSDRPWICQVHTAREFDFSRQTCVSLHLTLSAAPEHLSTGVISSPSKRAAQGWNDGSNLQKHFPAMEPKTSRVQKCQGIFTEIPLMFLKPKSLFRESAETSWTGRGAALISLEQDLPRGKRG